VEEVHNLYAEYKHKVDFITVYIAEAHTQDVWPLGQHVCVNKHITLDDRITACKRFMESVDWQLPTTVDSMTNGFMKTYLAHPERFYAMVDRKMAFKAQPYDAYYPLQQLIDWLVDYFGKTV